MTDLEDAMAPKSKLALSRAALLAAMGLKEMRTVDGSRTMEHVPEPIPTGPVASRLHATGLGRWWRKHPAQTAVALIEPGLQRYASRNPVRLVTYAAVAGCAIVLLKPWRLLSVGAVVTLLLKSSDIAGAVSTYLHGHGTGLRTGVRDDRL